MKGLRLSVTVVVPFLSILLIGNTARADESTAMLRAELDALRTQYEARIQALEDRLTAAEQQLTQQLLTVGLEEQAIVIDDDAGRPLAPEPQRARRICEIGDALANGLDAAPYALKGDALVEQRQNTSNAHEIAKVVAGRVRVLVS